MLDDDDEDEDEDATKPLGNTNDAFESTEKKSSYQEVSENKECFEI